MNKQTFERHKTRACPTCGAQPGGPCRIVNPTAEWSYEGRPYKMRFVHMARTFVPRKRVRARA